MRSLPARERPRERLLAGLEAGMKDEEFVAILLGSGGPGISALGVAQRLLSRFGSLRGIAAAPLAELCREPYVGRARAARLRAALGLARRFADERLPLGTVLPAAEAVHAHFWPRFRDERKEHFLAILLDGRNRILGEVTISEGTLNSSLVHPREAFRAAVREAAHAILFIHNHPSGDPTPSLEDRAITRRLVEVGKLLDIAVIDHVICAEIGYTSFAERGWM